MKDDLAPEGPFMLFDTKGGLRSFAAISTDYRLADLADNHNPKNYVCFARWSVNAASKNTRSHSTASLNIVMALDW